MQFELDFARRFRESADLMRSIAAGESNLHASGILDRIAEEYDRSAAELEALHMAHPEETPLPAHREPPPPVVADILAA
jgi:hypothetical protein